MAAFNKFQDFVEQLGKGVHQLHAAGHEFKVFLSNELPLAADTVKADVTPIAEENGYAAADIQNDYSEAAGTGTMTAVDYEWTALAGGFGPFRYVVLYNENAAAPLDALVGWWDYGSSISCAVGEKFKVDFGASLLTIA